MGVGGAGLRFHGAAVHCRKCRIGLLSLKPTEHCHSIKRCVINALQLFSIGKRETGAKLQVDLQVDVTQSDRGRLKTYRVDRGFLALIFSFVRLID